MSDTSALAAELRSEPPPVFADLTAAELARFTELIAAAKVQRDADVQDGIDQSLSALPSLLRAPVRKVLGL